MHCKKISAAKPHVHCICARHSYLAGVNTISKYDTTTPHELSNASRDTAGSKIKLADQVLSATPTLLDDHTSCCTDLLC
jgi:hypothetical protein